MSEYYPTHIRILQSLKQHADSFVSGMQLAADLGLSRTAVWKHIKSLQARGYEIESHSREGYRLVSVPDLLIPEEIIPGLKTVWLGRPYHHFPQIGSTNDYALKLAGGGAPNGTVIVAEEQTAGRGRLRRPWVSPPGTGIYMSIILRTPLPVQRAPQPTMVAALSLVTVLREKFAVGAAIKWPNDILIAGRKVAGILSEMQSDQDLVRFVVIGIGINANQGIESFKGPFRYPATSVAVEAGGPVSRQDLLLAFLDHFESEYDRFTEEGFEPLLSQLEACSAILGRNITVQCGSDELTGEALGFTPEGALRLQGKNGQEQVVWVGDVTQVRADF